jgi:hypothetical protein
MNSTGRLSLRMRGLARKVAARIRECNDAQRHMAMINSAPDRFMTRSSAAPDTYAEFLFRTSGRLLAEPSARARARRSDTVH